MVGQGDAIPKRKSHRTSSVLKDNHEVVNNNTPQPLHQQPQGLPAVDEHDGSGGGGGGGIISSLMESLSSSIASALVGLGQVGGSEYHHQQQQHRELCEGKGNHCFQPMEKNVFSPPTPDPPTPAPSARPTSFRIEPDVCVSDGQGNYGDIDGPSARTVEYRYQVETTDPYTAMVLNLEVLQDVEKAISDVLVQRFFNETCQSPPVIDIAVIPMPNIEPPQAPPIVVKSAIDNRNINKNKGGGHRNRFRHLKSEYHQNLVGLSAAPEDLVLEGSEGEACPFPTTDGPCFVVGGGLTVFGDNEVGSSRGLLWVDEPIHETLQESMNSGDLERTVQEEHPGIVAIRYIPPGTELPPNDITDPDGAEEGIIGGKTQALSWVLIGLGVVLLLGVCLYTLATRREQNKREQEEQTAIVVGAFPIVVSTENVALAQEAQEREEAGSSRYSTSHSREYISSPPDLLAGTYSDSDDDDIDHVFHDEEPSPSRMLPQGVSTSWRDQILHNPHDEAPEPPLGGGISLGPSQPFVQPILDDEYDVYPPAGRDYRSSRSTQSQSTHYHSVYSEEEYYRSPPPSNVSYYVGSSFSGSPRSSPSRDSPSKLSEAFNQSEII